MQRRSSGHVASAVTLALSLVFVAPAQRGMAQDDVRTGEARVPARGVVRVVDKADISTDLAARVSLVGFRFGERFKRGDVLIRFDCERYKAEAQSADAVHREMKLTLDSNMHLEKFNAVGKHDVEISRARVGKAEAEARALNSRLKQCEIVAPYDGRVAELTINAHEQPQPGRPFLSIVGDGRLEVELILPSQWLSWVKPGSAFVFQVDETKTDYDLRVVRLGAAVDAVSQMIKVIAEFNSPPSDVLPGMSGTAQFTQPNG
ncbi:MAG: efflux RND transporter periplasmic adaptor subunit [Hyphomicrobium sp.]